MNEHLQAAIASALLGHQERLFLKVTDSKELSQVEKHTAYTKLEDIGIAVTDTNLNKAQLLLSKFYREVFL